MSDQKVNTNFCLYSHGVKNKRATNKLDTEKSDSFFLLVYMSDVEKRGKKHFHIFAFVSD